MSGRRFPFWTLMGVVLVVALVIGTGVLSSPPPTAAQRAAAIDSVIRCPSCEDLSVATSSAPTAVTVRATVRQLVDEGRSDPQVEAYLEARYGSSIVLDPPASGWSLLVWVLPLAGGVVAVAGLAVVMVRRRDAVDGEPAGPGDGGPGGQTDDRVLEGQRRFLEQSLADADAEYLAGDLSDRDYLALRRRDMGRLAALGTRGTAVTAPGTVPGRPPVDAGPARPEDPALLVAEPPADPLPVATGAPVDAGPAAEAAASAEPHARDRPSRGRGRSWWFLGGAVAAFAGALVLSVVLSTSNRLPGQTATGGVDLSAQQQLTQMLGEAATYENEGQPAQAAVLYQSVLDSHPDNEVALAQLGWLDYETGRQSGDASLVAEGRAKLDRAVRLDPGDDAVRLYLGTVLLQQGGDAAGAVGEYRQFLADGPPPALVQQAAPELRQAYEEAGVPIPPQVPAA